MIETSKRLIAIGLRKVGYELRRAELSKSPNQRPICNDPFEALVRTFSGESVAFQCPLDSLTTHSGFNFKADGWHPFVAALQEYQSEQLAQYEGSLLQQYYKYYQPNNAAEARPDFDYAPSCFYRLPSWGAISPWSSGSVDENIRHLKRIHQKDNKEHGHPEMTVDSDGFPFHGPVSMRKGKLEYNRLISVHQSLSAHGYDRKHGHIGVGVVKRGSDHRFLLQGSGFHRTAAAAALGMETVPAQFTQPPIIDVDMASHWPQVKCGVWGREGAIRYVDHLFDFDPRDWAEGGGLLYSTGHECTS